MRMDSDNGSVYCFITPKLNRKEDEMLKNLWIMKKDKLQMWFAWRLPKWLVKWAAVRLIAHATTGKYSATVVPEMTAMDALKRWEGGIDGTFG